MSCLKIRLHTNLASRGLRTDAQILADLLVSFGHTIEMSGVVRDYSSELGRKVWSPSATSTRADIAICLETVVPRSMLNARHCWFIPNPEWLTAWGLDMLHEYDTILCKTAVAQEEFEVKGYSTVYVGFTSRDRLMTGATRHREFVHVAGTSPMKNTAKILELWKKYPSWPKLTVVGPSLRDDITTTNDRIEILDNLSEAELALLQNQKIFHLCPSEAEGWGHYIVEGQAVGGIVVTHDAPPMNEHIDPDCGILMRPISTGEAMGITQRWKMSEAELVEAVERCGQMSDSEVSERRIRARHRFLSRRQEFRERLERLFELT